jgi:acyl-CoA thioesterase I
MGWAAPRPQTCPVRTRVLLLTAALVAALSVALVTRAEAEDTSRCAEFRADSRARAQIVTGTGRRVVVIGDSWSAGLGLDRIGRSWPSRLPGRVHVAGFSGSGYSRSASPCGQVSFADRAGEAVGQHARLVVVQGGLNDWDRPDEEIREGFRQVMRVLRSRDVRRIVVVGPASAPSRAGEVPRLDALLRRLTERRGIDYVSTADLDLPYRGDRLHLTETGHRLFGEAVAARIAGLR